MTRRRLQQLFAIAIATAGCGSSASGLAGENALDLDVCEGTKWRAVKGLNPTTPVDYVSLRISNGAPPDGGAAAPDSILDEDGTPCGGAADISACKRAMSTLHNVGGWLLGGSSGGFGALEYIATTVKDDRVVYTSIPDLKKFLGRIDTASEAALIAETTGQTIVCGQHNAQKTGDGFVVLTTTGSACGPNDDVRKNLILVRPDGTTTVTESVVTKLTDPNCSFGRRPEGLACLTSVTNHLGDLLARIARLEAASVPAFGRFVRELRVHRAPRGLIARAMRAQRDEVRHARTMTKLAHKYRGRVEHFEVGALPPRSLEEVALDNAVEGCVRETYGALVATFQARNAADPEIAAAMLTIARDETEHAALSWDFAQWASAQLDDASRTRVNRARANALATLETELDAEPSADVVAAAGFPTRAQAKLLFASLRLHIEEPDGPPPGQPYMST